MEHLKQLKFQKIKIRKHKHTNPEFIYYVNILQEKHRQTESSRLQQVKAVVQPKENPETSFCRVTLSKVIIKDIKHLAIDQLYNTAVDSCIHDGITACIIITVRLLNFFPDLHMRMKASVQQQETRSIMWHVIQIEKLCCSRLKKNKLQTRYSI